jgi:hypothetical protein
MHLQARHGGRRTRRAALVDDSGSEVGAGGHDPARPTLRVIGVRYDEDESSVLIVEDMSE